MFIKFKQGRWGNRVTINTDKITEIIERNTDERKIEIYFEGEFHITLTDADDIAGFDLWLNNTADEVTR